MILDDLIKIAPQSEHKLLLALERFWYDKADLLFEDQKRETLPLKLTASEEQLALLKKSDLPFEHSDSQISFSLENPLRQPVTVIFSTKKYNWLSTNFTFEGGALKLSPESTMTEALMAAVLLARYPQLEMNLETRVAMCRADDLPQAFRRHAFKQIILGRKPSHGLKFLDHLGVLEIFLPEVTAGRGLMQNRYHAYDICEHLLRALDGAFDLNEPVRWSALLHDVGKVPTRLEGPNGEASFHNHEMYSARMVVPIMKRLGVPIAIGQKVKFLVRNHMFHYTDEWTDKAVRRFVKKVPLDELQDLISLRLADRKGSGKKSAFPKALSKLIDHIDEIVAEEKELKIKDLAIDGHTLMQLGMPQNKTMGDMLKFVFEEVKAGRAENTEAALTQLVQERLGMVATR